AAGSVCLMRKGRPGLAGLSAGYAALLRIFPVFLFAASALVLVWRAIQVAREKRGSAAPEDGPASGGSPRATPESAKNVFSHDAPRAVAHGTEDASASGGPRALVSRPGVPPHVRFLMGGLIAAVVLVPVSAGASGLEAYRGFWRNTVKHSETP